MGLMYCVHGADYLWLYNIQICPEMTLFQKKKGRYMKRSATTDNATFTNIPSKKISCEEQVEVEQPSTKSAPDNELPYHGKSSSDIKSIMLIHILHHLKINILTQWFCTLVLQ